MKLSFSTKGWRDCCWQDFCRMAKEYGFRGIELHDLREGFLRGRNGPLLPSAALRQLTDLELEIPCLDLLCDIGKGHRQEEHLEELRRCLDSAAELRIPYLRLRASGAPDAPAEADEPVRAFLEAALPLAEEAGVVLLVETYGLYADSARLRALLNRFARDSLAAQIGRAHV